MVAFSQRVSFFVGLLAALSVALLLAAAQGSAQGVEGEMDEEFAAGEIIVKLDEDATDGDLDRINRRNDAETEEELPRSDLAVVDLPNDLTVEEAVEIYEDSPDIEYAEPDYILRTTITPNDTDFPRMYALHNTGQTGGLSDADIDAPEAWEITTGSQDTVVAVIDEGVDINHPDLRENIWVNPDEIPGNGKDDDKNGYVDDVNGYDFANDDASVYDPDILTGAGDEHGTHVAGTIAASGDNDIGIVGVNWRASIMPLKFLEADGGFTSDAVEAINYAVREGVKVSNNSWGGGGYSQSLRDAISRADTAGHLFVAAAGNDSANNDTTPSYPANYALPNVVSVAATNHRDTLASFSNFGATSVDIAAPGVGILSTVPNNKYDDYNGTSMATPHVAGVAALLKSQNPSLDDAQLKSRILGSVDGKSGLSGKVATGGRLNAAAALSEAAEQDAPEALEVATPPPDAVRPSITPLRPRPGSIVKARKPLIVAAVRDDRTNLSRNDIKLFVDGRRKGFQYNAGNDRLVAANRKLSFKKHTIRILATDAAGNTAVRVWRFKVVR